MMVEGKKGLQFSIFNFHTYCTGTEDMVLNKIDDSSMPKAERPAGMQTLNQEEQSMSE